MHYEKSVSRRCTSIVWCTKREQPILCIATSIEASDLHNNGMFALCTAHETMLYAAPVKARVSGGRAQGEFGRPILMVRQCKAKLCRSIVLKKPASAFGDVPSKMCKKPASVCGDVQLCRNKVLKKPASAFGDASSTMCKKPADASDHGTRWQGLRVQVNGYRVACGAGHIERIKSALESLWSGRESWTSEEWATVADGHMKDMDTGANHHGGYRHGNRGMGWQHVRAASPEEDRGTPTQTHAGAEPPQNLPDTRSHPEVPFSKCAEAGSLPLAADPQGREQEFGLPAVLPAVRMRMGAAPRRQAAPKLSGYEIDQYLGGGSFGDVYKARWIEHGRNDPIVVKVMQTSGKNGKLSIEQREIDLLVSLKKFSHPNIIALQAWRKTHFNVQLMFPLYPMDLYKYINKSSVGETAAKTIASNLLSALQFLGLQQILHRDIKPQNILVQCEPLAAVLADFGAARYVLPTAGGGNACLSTDVCTLWYAAPECLLAKTSYTFPSDMWSAGVTVAHMETGIPPFRSRSQIGMLFSICKVCGTPSSCEWPALGMPALGLSGIMNMKILPAFRRASQMPWGSVFGQRFASFINDMLAILPANRRDNTLLASVEALW